jgi:hypothetical protein
MVCASWVVWDVGSYDHVALGGGAAELATFVLSFGGPGIQP